MFKNVNPYPYFNGNHNHSFNWQILSFSFLGVSSVFIFCWNCGAVMSPTHQCEENVEEEQVFKVIETENNKACRGREGHRKISCFESDLKNTTEIKRSSSVDCKLPSHSTD